MNIWIVTRHLPPEVSGGVRRPLVLAQGLRALGHDVSFVGPARAQVTPLIETPHPIFPSQSQASNETEAHTQAARKVSAKDRLLDWARRWLLLPDPEIRWALRVVRTMITAAQRSGVPDWIITTSPPESLHVAGYLAARKLKCRWVADVRDLWIERPQRRELEASALRRAIERIIARHVLSRADVIAAVSPVVLAEACVLAGPPRKVRPMGVIGHVSEAFDGAPERLPFETFNIVHTGSISLSNPLSQIEDLIGGFEDIVSKRPNARLLLAGRLAPDEEVKIATSPARHQIQALGVLSRNKARALQCGADALVLVSGPTSHALPGKYSEYRTTGLPILLAGGGPWRDLIDPDANVHEFAEAINMQKAPVTPAAVPDQHDDQPKNAAAILLALMSKAE